MYRSQLQLHRSGWRPDVSGRTGIAMATVEEGIQAQIRNIEATYGKPISQWLEIIAASGLTKHNDVVAMLKADYGMTHGAAHRISLVSRQASAPPAAPSHQADPVGALYTGKKAALRPLHDALMTVITGFGDDVELALKKGYVNLRRRKQFAMLQPSGAGRIDVGLILPGEPAQGRLESAAGFNALFTHRVRVSAPVDIDAAHRLAPPGLRQGLAGRTPSIHSHIRRPDPIRAPGIVPAALR
jgi:hypothetical protein